MKLSTLRKIYKAIPSKYLSPVTNIPFSVFCGAEYRKQISLLESYPKLSSNLKQKLQDDLAIDYLSESIIHTRFYRDFAKKNRIKRITSKEQLLEFPIIGKEQLESDLDWFIDDRYRNKSFFVSTGGTTGKQTRLLMSNSAFSKEWAFVNDYLSSEGVDINSRRICLRGSDGISSDKLIGYNHLYKEIMISPFRLNQQNLKYNINEIIEYKPKWIHGYPSSVSEFGNALSEIDIDTSIITNILLVSERLMPQQELAIKKQFPNCKISTFYGMTERVIFAPSENGSLIPNPLYGVTEEIDGQLVGTGFINKATRLIRYCTGDTAEVVKSSDGFVESITNVTGRWGKEQLKGKSGVNISMTALNIHSNILENVVKYQFFQENYGECVLLIQPGHGFKPGEEFKIASEFQNKTGSELIVKPKIVKDIPLTKRGKHQFIKTNCV
ncbi:hypothetical protein [Vibrio sp. 10N.239.311.D11]|uniref:hypothetical protein n=1 Tax=Vibrio sp. 10N.239.311.D11 TaxID=3229975 RepID=UPI003552FBD8